MEKCTAALSSQAERTKGAFGEAERKQSSTHSRWAEDSLLGSAGSRQETKEGEGAGEDTGSQAEILWVEQLIFPRDLEKKIGR